MIRTVKMQKYRQMTSALGLMQNDVVFKLRSGGSGIR